MLFQSRYSAFLACRLSAVEAEKRQYDKLQMWNQIETEKQWNEPRLKDLGKFNIHILILFFSRLTRNQDHSHSFVSLLLSWAPEKQKSYLSMYYKYGHSSKNIEICFQRSPITENVLLGPKHTFLGVVGGVRPKPVKNPLKIFAYPGQFLQF